MSTSDPTSVLGAGLPAGLPDVASLTQLANQLFLALPTAGQGGLGGPAAQPAAAVPAAVTSLPQLPGSLKPHAAGLPSSGPTFPGVAVLGAAIPSTPAIPGISKPGGLAGPSLPFASAPSFYFLEGAGPANRGPALPASVPATGGFDAEAVRRDFPILRERVNGRPLIWLDNAATTQKPQAVIDRLSRLYGKTAVLEAMPPWQGGGNMIQDATFEKTLYHPPPGFFEAG